MKNMIKRFAVVLLSASLSIGLMAGCGISGAKGEKTENGNKTLFSYDGVDVSLKKAWIYAKMSAAQYEASYASYFGENFWTMDMGTDEDGNAMTFEDYAKQQVIAQIKKIIVLNNKADEADASLSDEEKQQCEEYAEAFAKDASGKEILAECGASKEDVTEIYEENAIASKVQEYMIKDTDVSVSDDEARKTKISRVVFSTTKTDGEGQTVDMTGEEKAAELAKAQAALQELKNGKDIKKIAEEQEYTNTTETFAAGESEEGKKFEKLLSEMKDGDVTQEVQECENGYVIARLDAYTDASATESNRQAIIEKRQQTKFTEVYDSWTKDLEAEWSYKEDVDQELWSELILRKEDSTATEAAAETTGAEETSTATGEGTTAATGEETSTTAVTEEGTSEAAGEETSATAAK